MSATVLRAATRGSPLARWQADHVARLIRVAHPDVRGEVVTVETEGGRQFARLLTHLDSVRGVISVRRTGGNGAS